MYRHHFHKKTFSLIELIVVIATVVALASLLVPSLKKVVHSSYKLKCSSENLAVIYIAISNYTEDHQYSLPGPAISPTYQVEKSNLENLTIEEKYSLSKLQYFLLPYLEVETTNYGTGIRNMLCPSTEQLELERPQLTRSSYFLAKNLSHSESVTSLFTTNPVDGNTTLSSAESKSPFGEPEYHRSRDGYQRAGLSPMKMFQINAAKDQGIYDVFKDIGRIWIMPQYPVHTNQSINVMYLDGHVQSYFPDLINLNQNNQSIWHIL